MIKVDFHSHSIASPDGAITAAQYQRTIEQGILDCIAITDHNQTEFARKLHEQLGDKIIVGEEINTTHGELIGLFLSQTIAPNQSPRATAEAIHSQGGLVYAPHPFETVRKGMPLEALEEIADLIDIVEVYNGRAVFQNRTPQALAWAKQHSTRQAAAGDAHGLRGLGYTYTTVESIPTAASLLTLLDNAHITHRRPPFSTLLYPKLNRAKKRFLQRHAS